MLPSIRQDLQDKVTDARDDDELLEELERAIDEDSAMSGFREQMREHLKRELQSVRTMREEDHGTYIEIKVEKEVIQTSAKEKACVVHFFHQDFRRCQIMDKHIDTISKKHFRTRFFRVDVANVPWLVTKLKIQVLPCVMVFMDGNFKDRIVGFEELGNGDDFDTVTLELRLAQSGVITLRQPEKAGGSSQRGITGYPNKEDKDDDDDFWD